MTDKEKKSKIADILMDFQEEYSNEVINRPMLASLYAGNILSFIDSLQEEPISNNFEEALAQEWKGYNDRGAATVDALEDNTQELAFAKGFYRGAKWQEKQDQETIELAEDHAMLSGMNKMKEQMMAKAIDAEIVNADTHLKLYMNHDAFKETQFKNYGRCKVIIIKEE